MRVRVRVKEGKSLGKLFDCDPYCLVSLGSEGSVVVPFTASSTRLFRTNTITADNNPVWDQVFEFEHVGDSEQKVSIEVWDAKRGSADVLLGQAIVNLHEFSPEKEHERWHNLTNGAVENMSEAKVLLSVTVIRDKPDTSQPKIVQKAPYSHSGPQDLAKFIPEASSTESEEDARQRAIAEFISSENSFLEVLNTLYGVLDRSLLPKPDRDTIFGNLAELLGFHTDLVQELKALQDKNPVIQNFGSIMSKRSNLLKIYWTFYSEQIDIKEKIEATKAKNQKFAAFLTECLELPQCHMTPLEVLLNRPFQRIVKYPQLIERVLRHTPKEHPDRKGVEDLLTAVQDVVVQLMEKKQRLENTEKLTVLQEKIENSKEHNFVDENRSIIKEGTLIMHKPDTGNDTEVYVILFNDQLAICEPSKRTLRERERETRRTLKSSRSPATPSLEPTSPPNSPGGGWQSAAVMSPRNPTYRVIDVVPATHLMYRQRRLSAGNLEDVLGKEKEKKDKKQKRNKGTALSFIQVDGHMIIKKEERKKIKKGKKKERNSKDVLELQTWITSCSFDLVDVRTATTLSFRAPSPADKADWVKKLKAVASSSPHQSPRSRTRHRAHSVDLEFSLAVQKLDGLKDWGEKEENGGGKSDKESGSSEGGKDKGKKSKKDKKKAGKAEDRERKKSKEDEDKKRKVKIGAEEGIGDHGAAAPSDGPKPKESPRKQDQQDAPATPTAPDDAKKAPAADATPVSAPAPKKGGKEGFKWVPNPKGKGFIFVKEGPATAAKPGSGADLTKSAPAETMAGVRPLLTRAPRSAGGLGSQVMIGLGNAADAKDEQPPAATKPAVPTAATPAGGGAAVRKSGEAKVVQMEKVKQVVAEAIDVLNANLEERRQALHEMGDDVKMDVVVDIAKRIRAVKKELGV